MKTYIRTFLAALGRVLIDRFEQNLNSPPYPTYSRSAPTDTWQRQAAKPIKFEQPFTGRLEGPHDFPPQIKPPTRWHRVAVSTPEIPYVHCYVCKRAAPWELGDLCPGPPS